MSPTAPNTTARSSRSTSNRSASSRSANGNRSTAAKRAAATRRANARRRSAAAKRGAATRELNQRNPVQKAQDLAERAVLVPVGAALVTRDRVFETVTDAVKPYRNRESAQRQLERDLKRFERRGTTARNRAERQIKRTRTRVERELRQQRNAVQRVIKRNRTRVERETRSVRRDVKRQGRGAQRTASQRGGLVGARVDEAVAAGEKAVATVQERVTNAVT